MVELNSNMAAYNKMRQPPLTALKTIGAGRLKGKTDINPQWRYEMMTEVYGPCGEGWKYEITKLWTEPGPKEEVFAFAQVNVYVKTNNGEWGAPIPGIGGSKLVTLESNGLHASDEGYKMATTDALSVALKMLGVAADIYAGKWDGSKYINQPSPTPELITAEQVKEIENLLAETGTDEAAWLKLGKIGKIADLPAARLAGAKAFFDKKKANMKREPGSEG